jgi:hypothetical protein
MVEVTVPIACYLILPERGSAARRQGGRVSTYQDFIDAKARLEEDERETWRLES